MEKTEDLVELLKSIRSNQETQLHRQQEALELQKEQYEMVKKQFVRAEKLQDRAESIQNSSARLMGAARKTLVVILPIIFGLIVYLSWLIFR